MSLSILWIHGADTPPSSDLLTIEGVSVTSEAYNPEGLLPFFKRAQQQARDTKTPCLLLFEGESLDIDTLKNALQNPGSSTVQAWVAHPEHSELSPRLFFPDSTATPEGQRFISISDITAPQLSIKARDCVYTTHFTAHGESPDLVFYRSFKHFKALEDAQALSGFKQLLVETPGTNFWHQLGVVMYLKTLWESQQHQFAFEELERLRKAEQGLERFPALWILRGVIAQQFQAVDMAFECFDMAMELPQREDFKAHHYFIETADLTWKPLLGSGELALKEGMYLKAARLFKQTAHYLPDHDYVLGGWLQSAFLTQKYDEAQEILARKPVLRGISDTARSSLKLFFEAREGKFDAESLTALIQHDVSQDAFALSIWTELAVTCLKQKQSALARPFFLQVLRFQPDQVMLWHNLAYSYFEENNYTKAEKYYRQALNVTPHYPSSQLDLAKTLVMQNRVGEAIETLKDLLKVHPRFQEARKALQNLSEQHMPPAPAESPVLSAPFVFAFPFDASSPWSGGLDLLMKAYYEEFVPSDNTVLALPFGTEAAPQMVHEARSWAMENMQEALLPPVVLLEEALPMIPGFGAWVIPWRESPTDKTIEALARQNYPVMAPEPAGVLKAHWQLDLQQQRGWKEVGLESLRLEMRRLLQHSRQAGPQTFETLSTHALLHEGHPDPDAEPDLDTPPEHRAKTRTVDSAELRKTTPSLGVCMIVKNEEQVLSQALDSITKEAEEVVVMDTGSTDQTLTILADYAQRYPHVRYAEIPWNDDFSAARNAAFAKATTDWVLFLDADEYVKPDFIPRLRLELNQHDTDAYCFKVLSVLENGDIDPHTSLGGVPRLFQNTGAYRFEGRIHEVVYHEERETLRYVYPKHLPIYHVGYRPAVVEEKQKSTRDRELMENAIAEAPESRSSKRLYGILAQDYLNAGNFERARHYLEAGLALNHDDQQIKETLFYKLQSLRAEQGQLKEALAAMEQVSETRHDARFLLLWGQLLNRGEQWSAAYGRFQDALEQWYTEVEKPDPLELRPNLESILEELIDVTSLLEKHPDHLHYLERYLKRHPQPDSRLWKRYRQLTALATD